MLWFVMMACQEEIKSEPKDTSTVEDTQPDVDTDPPDTQPPVVDTGEPPPAIQGNFTGGIDIQLFTLSQTNNREFISWEEAYPDGTFPFGNIFVGAYYINTTGETVWLGSDVIENPQATGNAFEIDYELDLAQEVRVFAILDYNKDNITGTDEPLGVYPEESVSTLKKPASKISTLTSFLRFMSQSQTVPAEWIRFPLMVKPF